MEIAAHCSETHVSASSVVDFPALLSNGNISPTHTFRLVLCIVFDNCNDSDWIVFVVILS